MAELRPHYIDVDLKKNTQYNVPVVTQNDTATHFIIRVTDDGLSDPELLDAYQEITMTSQRPDGESFYLTGTRIPDTNEIEFHLGTDETAFSGSVLASLQFYLMEDASRYTSAQFRYDVKKDLTKNYTPTQREETLVEVVLRDGPGVIQEAREAKQAVDGALVDLEQDKTAAIDRLDEVTEENKTVFRQPVNTFADLATTYPNPEHGTTVRVTSEAASYRYSDGTWVKTDEYNPTAIDQVTAQLAEKAEKGKIISSDLSTASDSEKIKLINLSDEVQQALTGDAPALSVIPSEGVTKEKIARNSIDFLKHTEQVPLTFKVRPRNLFNKKQALIGYSMSSGTGLTAINASYFTSDFIPVQGGLNYSITNHRFLAWFDADKQFISGVSDTNVPATVIAPANAKYLRTSTLLTSIDTYMVEQAETVGTYQPYYTELKLNPHEYFSDKSIGAELLKDGSVTQNKLTFFSVGKNLFNKDSATTGFYVSASNGNVSANATYAVSDYIEIEPNTTYARSYINQLAFYDSNKAFISGISVAGATTTFVTPTNAKFIRVTILVTGLNSYQLEKGSTSTIYEPFAYKISSELIRDEGSSGSQSAYKTIQSISSQLVLSDTLKKVKLIGDSITHGSGGTGFAQDGELIMTVGPTSWNVNTNGHCWANSLKSFLESKHNCEVKNYGCSGANSKTLVTGLSQLIDGDEDIVICMIGTNDRHNNTKQELSNNLKTIHQYCISRNIEIIFMSSVPSSVAIDSDPIRNYHMEDVDHVIMKTASDLGLEYISVYKEFMEYCLNRNIEIDSLLVDGLHPNNAGYDAMFYIIARALGFGVKRPGATW